MIGLSLGHDIATDDLNVRESGLEMVDDVDLIHGVSLRGVDHDHIRPSSNQGLRRGER
jgi:hypothetical protein